MNQYTILCLNKILNLFDRLLASLKALHQDVKEFMHKGVCLSMENTNPLIILQFYNGTHLSPPLVLKPLTIDRSSLFVILHLSVCPIMQAEQPYLSKIL